MRRLSTLLLVSCLATTLASTASLAASCYRLSKDGVTWPRTPEVMCIEALGDSGKHQISLRTGDLLAPTTIATFVLDEIEVLGPALVYGVANPSNSIFNDLQVQLHFDSPTDASTGQVLFGATRYFYRATP